MRRFGEPWHELLGSHPGPVSTNESERTRPPEASNRAESILHTSWIKLALADQRHAALLAPPLIDLIGRHDSVVLLHRQHVNMGRRLLDFVPDSIRKPGRNQRNLRASDPRL